MEGRRSVVSCTDGGSCRGPGVLDHVVGAQTPKRDRSGGPDIVPGGTNIRNFKYLFATTPYATNLRNSIIVAAGTMLGNIVISTLGSYALYRMKMQGARTISILVLATYAPAGTC